MDEGQFSSGTVTFLFSDIEGSTQLWEQFPQPMGTALARHDLTLRGAITTNNGRLVKTIGDGAPAVLAVAFDALTTALAIPREMSVAAAGPPVPPTSTLPGKRGGGMGMERAVEYALSSS